MATFTGTTNNDTADATANSGAGSLNGFGGGTLAELIDNLGDTFNASGGADTIVAGAGNDTLNGGLGADSLNGGSGFDVATYVDAGQGLTARLDTPGLNTFGATGDSYVSIEGLIGSSFSDTLAGNTGGNLLDGGNGTGDDTLLAGDGNDTLIGGLGADSLDGGDGIDTASYVNASVGVIANLANSGLNTQGASGDTYVSIESLYGSSLADQLVGNAGDNTLDGGATASNDTLIGGDGNDTLIGGLGADSLDGGDGFDIASYVFAGAGLTLVVNLADPGLNTRGAQGDIYVSIEGLIGSSFVDHLTGNAGDNLLDSGAGDDTLVGGAGLDTMTGGDGNNSITAGNDDDFLTGGFGNDTLDGGAGSDTADFSAALAAIGLALGASGDGVVFAGSIGTDTLLGIENLIGGSAGDTLYGNAVANALTGNGGGDTLWGSYGADGAADALEGGDGSDTYFVYETSDVVTETNANTGTGGLDLVYSFSNRTLSANVEYLTLFGNNAALNSAIGNDGDNALNAMQYVGGNGINFVDDIGNDVVFASYYADTISTGLGNDTLWGSWGADGAADAMTGGDGADTYYVQEALDTVTETNAGTGPSEIDTVYSAIDMTLGANLEYLFIYGNATLAAGNSLDNALIGSYSGLQLTFNGFGGSDNITGGARQRHHRRRRRRRLPDRLGRRGHVQVHRRRGQRRLHHRLRWCGRLACSIHCSSSATAAARRSRRTARRSGRSPTTAAPAPTSSTSSTARPSTHGLPVRVSAGCWFATEVQSGPRVVLVDPRACPEVGNWRGVVKPNRGPSHGRSDRRRSKGGDLH